MYLYTLAISENVKEHKSEVVKSGEFTGQVKYLLQNLQIWLEQSVLLHFLYHNLT